MNKRIPTPSENILTLGLRVSRCEENLHLARSIHLARAQRIIARRERLLADAIAKLSPSDLAHYRAYRAEMHGFNR